MLHPPLRVAALEQDARLDSEPRANVSRPDLAHKRVARKVRVEPLVEVFVGLFVAIELHNLTELQRRCIARGKTRRRTRAMVGRLTRSPRHC